MNPFLLIILLALTTRFLLHLLADILNLRHASDDIPAEFQGRFVPAEYKRSQSYLRDKTKFNIASDILEMLLLAILILTGALNLLDRLVRAPDFGPIATGLLFSGALVLSTRLLRLPFSIYFTFGIEARYGFNRTSPRTFLADRLKSLLLTAVVGGALFAAVLAAFEYAGPLAWLYVWAALTLFQVFLVFLAPYVIFPLFNKYSPLDPGELRTALEQYAAAQNFKMKGVFTMDGSRRSSKANAFFTGLGRSRRIVLLDTLIARHTIPEVLAVLAHEMAHFKKKHILSAMARSTLAAGLSLFLLSFFIRRPTLFAAFQMDHVSTHAGIVLFGFLYSPIATVIGVLEAVISRKHEYEADRDAAETTRNPDAMIEALQTLSVDNLANLTPHPLKVILDDSHPPVLSRIRRLRSLPHPAPPP